MLATLAPCTSPGLVKVPALFKVAPLVKRMKPVSKVVSPLRLSTRPVVRNRLPWLSAALPLMVVVPASCITPPAHCREPALRVPVPPSVPSEAVNKPLMKEALFMLSAPPVRLKAAPA